MLIGCVCVLVCQLTQHSFLSKLPRVLILHLKRFQPNYKTGTYEKRQDLVKFDQTIDVSKYVTDDVQTPQLSKAEEDALTAAAAKAAAAANGATASPARPSKRKSPATDSSPRTPSPSARNAKAAKLDDEAKDSMEEEDAEDEELQRALKASVAVPKTQAQIEEEQLQQAIAASMEDAKPVAAAASTSSPARSSRSSAAAAAPAVAAAPRVRHCYELLSVVIHKGVTASSGHYVTQILEAEKNKPASTLPFTAAAAGGAAAAAASSSSSAKGSANAKSLLPKSSPRVWKEYDDSYVTLVSELILMHTGRDG